MVSLPGVVTGAGHGDVAVVAGAAGALGRAVAARLMAEGWRVAAVDRGASIDRVPEGAEAVICDLSDPVAVEAVADRAAQMGRWRACVVCSGGFAGGRAHELGDAAMREQLELNLLGPWRLLSTGARAMGHDGTAGRLVLTVGRAAVDVVAGQAGYQLSKVAAARLVQVMALELRDTGMTVNGVLPSTMDTPANRLAMPDADHSRWVPVDHVAGVVAWLCGEGAADVTGALLPVYGRA